MADNIDFGDTTEQVLMVLRTLTSMMHADLYNGGKDGLLTRFNKFVTDHDAREEERDAAVERHHVENAQRLAEISNRLGHRSLAWTVAGVLVGVLALIGCAVGIMVSIRLAHGMSMPSLLGHNPSILADMSKLPNTR
jgi:hypothetical protein